MALPFSYRQNCSFETNWSLIMWYKYYFLISHYFLHTIILEIILPQRLDEIRAFAYVCLCVYDGYNALQY